jgi:hypothetical protein
MRDAVPQEFGEPKTFFKTPGESSFQKPYFVPEKLQQCF